MKSTELGNWDDSFCPDCWQKEAKMKDLTNEVRRLGRLVAQRKVDKSDNWRDIQDEERQKAYIKNLGKNAKRNNSTKRSI